MEERVPAQHFDIPVLEVEGIMRSYCRRIGERPVIGSVCSRGLDGSLVIGAICDCEVGQSGGADGWRPGDGRSRGCVFLWSSDRFGWRGLGNLRFKTWVTALSEEC